MRGSSLDQLQLIRGQCESAQLQIHASVERQGRARPNGYSLALFGRSGRPQWLLVCAATSCSMSCRNSSLIIEAQIAVNDISDVRPDMNADVHLTAYKARITPVVRGKVIQVSADRLTDNRTGNPYYLALVRVDEGELAELPNVRLYPGMPATVMIPTINRTALDYLVGPLTQSFNRAFRQN